MEGKEPGHATATGEPAPSPLEATHDEIVNVPRVSRNFEDRKKWIVNESRQSINRFAIASKKVGRVPNLNDPGIQDFLDRAKRLLTLLEHDFQVEPRYRDQANLSDILKLVFDDFRFHFPEDVKDRARALYEDFEANDWGAIDVSQDDDAEDQPASPDSTGKSDDQQPVGNVTMRILLPPRDHPIWGVHGIMHGACPVEGRIRTTRLDRRYNAEKRPANVFGHNGLQPGAWFPTQLVALFHGAHGARMAGIHGNVVDGTYSVVVAGMYEDVDEE